jgi:hypothetical protein
MKNIRSKTLGGVLIATLIYWYFIYSHYQILNSRPHGLLYIFPISLIFGIGMHKIGMGIIFFNLLLSLFINIFLSLSALQMAKVSISTKLLRVRIVSWAGIVLAILLIFLYNYLCLTSYMVE